MASSRHGKHARFFREAIAQLGVKREWGRTPPVPWKDAKWLVPEKVKESIAISCPFHGFHVEIEPIQFLFQSIFPRIYSQTIPNVISGHLKRFMLIQISLTPIKCQPLLRKKSLHMPINACYKDATFPQEVITGTASTPQEWQQIRAFTTVLVRFRNFTAIGIRHSPYHDSESTLIGIILVWACNYRIVATDSKKYR